MIAPKSYADEYELTDELQIEDVVIGQATRESAYVDPDDDEYDWTPVR